MKKELHIPIYDAVLWLIVADDIAAERKLMSHWFGPVPDGNQYDAICSYGDGHNFALFFEPQACTIKTVSHEVFHLTHRILDWSGAHFDSSHHEQGSLLHGYLMDMVIRELKDSGFPDDIDSK
jgi:hypothetical protein